MKKDKTYRDKLMADKEFRKKFNKEYLNLFVSQENSKSVQKRKEHEY